jgi:hypothetical protein
MDQFEFVNKLNIQRFQNLLETSLNDSERQIIQKKSQAASERIKTEVGINQPPSDAMIMRAASESRFLGLDGADWSMLLAG